MKDSQSKQHWIVRLSIIRALLGIAMRIVSEKCLQLGDLDLEKTVQSTVGPKRGTTLTYGHKDSGENQKRKMER